MSDLYKTHPTMSNFLVLMMLLIGEMVFLLSPCLADSQNTDENHSGIGLATSLRPTRSPPPRVCRAKPWLTGCVPWRKKKRPPPPPGRGRDVIGKPAHPPRRLARPWERPFRRLRPAQPPAIKF
ncbi:hypothetical protein Salat_1548000 [Sesamum alatum]|uniref:Uncharacterized protein n=1 Tax=Sesamum alatum TaxID=300844 RepID=A0AAE2CMP2_9LAMI|nr:hypothetical protein Salat_1548000 [Sesamum alatum]